MIEIAVASGKGGVGKSTLAASLLIILKDRGWNVIGVDADADAPNLHLILGIDKWDNVTPFSDSKVAEIIDEKCIKCGECIKACPHGAIYIDDQGRYMVFSGQIVYIQIANISEFGDCDPIYVKIC